MNSKWNIPFPAHAKLAGESDDLALHGDLGPQFILPDDLAMKTRTARRCDTDSREAEALMFAKDEKSHARLLSMASKSSKRGCQAHLWRKARGVTATSGGNALRAAVLGANDGLVSILSLVMGVAGATSSNSQVLIAGLAGLLASAGSMALGEWLSVQSSRELYENQIKLSRRMLKVQKKSWKN
ncbi:MAG: VIT1/CCC1 transporter family protein [Anaerolineales bacterium]|nr:VIT1/CCC1 transporter family protein [Anaerolineales bacterium]